MNIGPTILRKKIEELREARPSVSSSDVSIAAWPVDLTRVRRHNSYRDRPLGLSLAGALDCDGEALIDYSASRTIGPGFVLMLIEERL
jgi:hypothetical protein